MVKYPYCFGTNLAKPPLMLVSFNAAERLECALSNVTCLKLASLLVMLITRNTAIGNASNPINANVAHILSSFTLKPYSRRKFVSSAKQFLPLHTFLQRRRREIFVETRLKKFPAPSGAKYPEYAARRGLGFYCFGSTNMSHLRRWNLSAPKLFRHLELEAAILKLFNPAWIPAKPSSP